jgi:hypothetical protein
MQDEEIANSGNSSEPELTPAMQISPQFPGFRSCLRFAWDLLGFLRNTSVFGIAHVMFAPSRCLGVQKWMPTSGSRAFKCSDWSRETSRLQFTPCRGSPTT